jgi:hypothetical protein
MRPETLDRETALEKAKAVVRAFSELEIGTVTHGKHSFVSFRDYLPGAPGSKRPRRPSVGPFNRKLLDVSLDCLSR